MGRIFKKYVMAAVIPGVALSLTIIVSTLSSCSFDVEFRFGFPGDRDVKPDKRSAKESVEDKPVPKLSMLYVYGDTVLKGITLGEMIGDGLLKAEIDKSDNPYPRRGSISIGMYPTPRICAAAGRNRRCQVSVRGGAVFPGGLRVLWIFNPYGVMVFNSMKNAAYG